MVSQTDREILRAELRSRGDKLNAADRENLLKPYLPDPADLPPTSSSNSSRRSRAATSSSQRRQKPRRKPVRTFLKSQLHRLTYAITHIFFGIAVRLLQAYHAVVDRVFAIVYHHHRTPELIRKDVRGLKRLPEHLSVILTLHKEDDALAVLMDEVAELAAWSACAGIPQLSVYEKSGVLKSCIPALHQIISTKLASYFGTPAQQPTLQLFAPHHPVHGTAPNPKSETPSLTLLLLSSTDGRETIVDLTKTLAEMSQNGKLSPEDITPELVDAEISEITTQPLQASGHGVSPLKPEPDLLLIFGPFLKLDGYPPWQIRLTEMYCTGDRNHGMTGYGEAVEYQGFMRGLWHYAGAQMRFGR
ncbi:Dehydrodolichyl diphosphate synthase complex subunit NUS1 [Penicillium rolfsii]|nr:Dehydrodolichyl diphosphate synthase complex subunit NUS1 [Penicillium rolfsii]